MTHFEHQWGPFALPPRARRWVLGPLGIIGGAALVIALRATYVPAPLAVTNEVHLPVAAGDTMASISARAELPDAELLALREAVQRAASDFDLAPGEVVRVARRGSGKLGYLLVDHADGEVSAFIRDASRDHFTFSRQPAASVPALLAKPLHDRIPDPALAGADGRESAPEEMPELVPVDDPALATAPIEPVLPPPPPPPPPMERVEVKRGDSLSRIFNRNDLPQTDLALLLEAGEDGRALRRIHPGQNIAFRKGADGRIERFEHEIDALSFVRFTRSPDGNGYASERMERAHEEHDVLVRGTIHSSLYAAAGNTPDQVIEQLVRVLGWDIDFARDLRQGDRFSILYRELRVNGRFARADDILALEFHLQQGGKEPIRAFRYTRADGDTDYFAPDGRALQRAFTRNPLDYTRISSRFSKSRLHPVHKRYRPHRGVDYAAPRGTPVRATGNGRVAFVGRKGGYGKTIILDHGNGYSTLYAHLTSYASKVRRGRRVQQNQFIGRVGSTGVSTGPHLHYEFRIKGVHRDPLKVEFPRVVALAKSEMDAFRSAIKPLVARLDARDADQLASLRR